MNLPESLPARMYLLAYDTGKNRLTARSQLGLVPRAAALTELYLAGQVADEEGRARPAGDRRPSRRPAGGLLVRADRRAPAAPWHRWIGRGERSRSVPYATGSRRSGTSRWSGGRSCPTGSSRGTGTP